MIVGPSNLVFQTLKASPTAHDEWVVSSYKRDDIDPLCFELFILLKIWGQVVRVASGLRGSGEIKASWMPSQEQTLTVNAPGTETITTFFPFNWSVFKEVAGLFSRVITDIPCKQGNFFLTDSTCKL